ncbi:hypothetical protein ACFPVY_12410 [Flavobacterium qiangtangense]|uniref:Uncharacterized protein n=1 Tax=Flavobacterium qiangtangense TaxID=1442595 RepID=A0ABW1PPI6_9FLAO
MKYLYLFLFASFTSFAQTGIGISSQEVNAGAILQLESTTKAFVPPRMSDAQMLAIASPLIGSLVYNLTYDSLYMYTNTGWKNVSITVNASVVLNKSYATGNDAVTNSDNNYVKFPLVSADIQTNTPAVFEVTSNGTVKVKESGIFLVSAGFSISNLPAGNIKYIIGIYRGETLIGYLSRGVTALTATDEWGTSGTSVITATANDLISFRYVINNGGVPLDAIFFNIGMTKIK